MLLSWVISLQPAEAVSTPTNLGRAAHAWFLEQVRRADADLAQELHQGHGLRPFAISNLWPLGSQQKTKITLSPAKNYTLRVTSFSPQLSALLREQIIPHPPQALTLGPAAMQVTDSTTDSSKHSWAGKDTFEELVQRHTLESTAPPRVSLRFFSPTLFRSEDKDIPLPLPGLVFGGLLDKWNAFAPIEVHQGVRRFAQECLAVSRYQLETQLLRFGADGARGAVAGCVGRCTYAILVHDKYWMRLIHLLAAFAFYAGVGRRTTMGLGQTRPLTRKK